MAIDIQETRRPAPPQGFEYRHGDRPLGGYVIERGAGRGGFGEVYYALSDGGREVALKLIQTHEQIELRGIAQCMNLKSPHLVTIFDVKRAGDGRAWVVMEYVAGPSLRELIDASPGGIGIQKAAFFLREIGKGLTYLHDCGVVHRDLKPANIFFEDGYVKICDYGLSKAMSVNQFSKQTITIGTVHYMAPEIGQGRYDQSIDIYALGALLFEMLTGQVPFFGATAAEVLMKHLGAPVDVKAIPEPFATVIAKAMAKNPADRYQSVQEMVEAVFGAEHVRNSVSHFSPNDLSIVAGHAARRISHGNGPFAAFGAPSPIFGMENLRRFRSRCIAPVKNMLLNKRPPIAEYFTPQRQNAMESAQNRTAAFADANRGRPLIPRPVIFLWLCAFVVAALISLMFFARWARGNSPEDSGIIGGMFLAAAVFARAFYLRAKERYYTGFWMYAMRPLILTGCTASAIVAGCALLFGARGDDGMTAVFFLIAPLIVWASIKHIFPAFLSNPGLPMAAVASLQTARPFSPVLPVSPAPSAGRRDWSLASRAAGALLRFAFSLAGSLLLLVAIALALAVAVDVPGLLNSHLLPDPQSRAEIRRTFGRADWPQTMRNIAAAASFGFGILATALLILGRRRGDFAHRFRVIVAVVMLFASVSILGHGLPDWSDLVIGRNPWEGIDEFMRHADRMIAILSLAVAGAAMLVLLWPAAGKAAAKKAVAANGAKTAV